MLRTFVVALILCATAALAGAAPRGSVPDAEQRATALLEADIFVARGAFERAIPRYRTALAAGPEDAVLRNRLGICYQRTGRLEQALEQYEAALKVDPDYAEAWNNVGALHHAAGDLDEAIESYRRALAVKKLASTYQNLGAALLRQEKVREAFDAYRSAYALSPAVFVSDGVPAPGGDLATQYYYFAKLFAADGQVEQAITYLEKAREQGFRDMVAVSADPDFAAAIDNPRFVALIQPQS